MTKRPICRNSNNSQRNRKVYSDVLQNGALCSTLYDQARSHLSLSRLFLRGELAILCLGEFNCFTLLVSVVMVTLLT